MRFQETFLESTSLNPKTLNPNFARNHLRMINQKKGSLQHSQSLTSLFSREVQCPDPSTTALSSKAEKIYETWKPPKPDTPPED